MAETKKKKPGRPKGQFVWFDKKTFLQSESNFNHFVAAFDQLVNELSKFADVPKGDAKEILADPKKYVESFILDAHKDVNVMNLSYPKLVGILELNVGPVESAAFKLAQYHRKSLAKPKETDFHVYTKTQDQEKRLAAIKKIIDGFEMIREIYPGFNGRQYVSQMANGFRDGFIVEGNGTIVPNPKFIMR